MGGETVSVGLPAHGAPKSFEDPDRGIDRWDTLPKHSATFVYNQT